MDGEDEGNGVRKKGINLRGEKKGRVKCKWKGKHSKGEKVDRERDGKWLARKELLVFQRRGEWWGRVFSLI